MATVIYIVEDDQSSKNYLVTGLKKNGFTIRSFDSGYPVIEMMDQWPDAFLIEIDLRGINGMEICKWLKSHEDSSKIPVILISGDSYLKILSQSAPADAYIEKQASISTIIDTVGNCLIDAQEKVS